ncbi:MAG: GNAT family N-acetyltransferase [bacterium]|nr:GNAT family N-acetyltransferase [bacterium]
MKIREATINDIDEIHSLGNTVNEFSVSDEVVIFWPKHILHNCIKSQTDYLLIAKEKEKIIGFIIINNSLVFKKTIIENIYILPQFRKKGFGTKLLNMAIKKIKTTGCEYICLLTNNYEAIKFYESNSFEKGKDFVWLDKVLSKKFSLKI